MISIFSALFLVGCCGIEKKNDIDISKKYIDNIIFQYFSNKIKNTVAVRNKLANCTVFICRVAGSG